MLNDKDVLRREIVRSCSGATAAFTESVSAAFSVLFEDGEIIPVNVANLVNSPAADTIPAQLRTAQATAKNAQAQEKELEDTKGTLGEQVQTLRDTLGIASQDQNENTAGQEAQPGSTNGTP